MGRALEDRAPITQHHYAIGDGPDLIEPVRDKQHSRAGARDLADCVKEAIRFAGMEARRRFIKDEDAVGSVPAVHGAGQRHDGAFGRGEQRNRRSHINGRSRPLDELRRPGVFSPTTTRQQVARTKRSCQIEVLRCAQ
jgi:hypothetical protein